MRKLAVILAASILALALHAVAMALWHQGHSEPFHAGGVSLSCPMGDICPATMEVLRTTLAAAVSGSSGARFPVLLALLTLSALVALVFIYRPPPKVTVPTDPKRLLSVLKRE